MRSALRSGFGIGALGGGPAAVMGSAVAATGLDEEMDRTQAGERPAAWHFWPFDSSSRNARCNIVRRMVVDDSIEEAALRQAATSRPCLDRE